MESQSALRSVSLIRTLLDFLVNDNVETARAAAQALKHVMTTSQAQQDLEWLRTKGESDKELEMLVHPFTNALVKVNCDYNAVATSAGNSLFVAPFAQCPCIVL